MYRVVRNRVCQNDNARRVLDCEDEAGGRIHIGMLAVHMLLNGYSYYIPQLNKAKKVAALGVHLTWVPLSVEGKFQRMRDGGFWHDPPEYYTGVAEKKCSGMTPPSTTQVWRKTNASGTIPPSTTQVWRAAEHGLARPCSRWYPSWSSNPESWLLSSADTMLTQESGCWQGFPQRNPVVNPATSLLVGTLLLSLRGFAHREQGFWCIC